MTEGGSWSMADEMLSDRRRENSARRLAQAVGLKVSKAGRRDMNFPDFGRFSVWDAELGRAVSPTGEYFDRSESGGAPHYENGVEQDRVPSSRYTRQPPYAQVAVRVRTLAVPPRVPGWLFAGGSSDPFPKLLDVSAT